MISLLQTFADENGFIGKGPLSVAIFVTEHARNLLDEEASGGSKAFPIDSRSLLAQSGTQVRGISSAAIQSILQRNGVNDLLSREAGRTSRGSVSKMQQYVTFLNEQASAGNLDIDLAEEFWIARVNGFLSGKPFVLKIDAAWGLRAAIRHLTGQAVHRQKGAGGSMLLGTLMQHLVGAKLEVLLGAGCVEHHSANQSDQKQGRHGDFDIEDVAIHVTSAPTEMLVHKCHENLGKGKLPVIVTTQKGLLTAEGLLTNVGLGERVDLIEFEQFIATNIFELSRFNGPSRTVTMHNIVNAYNAIIESHETPSLRIQFTDGK